MHNVQCIRHSLGCWTLWVGSPFTRMPHLKTTSLECHPTRNHIATSTTCSQPFHSKPQHSKPPCNKYYLLETTPLESTTTQNHLSRITPHSEYHPTQNHPTRNHPTRNHPTRVPPTPSLTHGRSFNSLQSQPTSSPTYFSYARVHPYCAYES